MAALHHNRVFVKDGLNTDFGVNLSNLSKDLAKVVNIDRPDPWRSWFSGPSTLQVIHVYCNQAFISTNQ